MQEHPQTDNETPQHWPKGMPFRLPEDYFIKQREQILQSLEYDWKQHTPESPNSELERISPLLSALKQSGITGRWNDSKPDIEFQPSTQHEIVVKSEKRYKNRSIISPKTWMAAAGLTGLLLLGKIILDHPISHPNLTDANQSADNIPDSFGFSDADINAYLSDISVFPAATISDTSKHTDMEQFMASADMLTAPEKFTQQMEAIPVHDLEAYITDIPTFND
jgi:hypothetical protein